MIKYFIIPFLFIYSCQVFSQTNPEEGKKNAISDSNALREKSVLTNQKDLIDIFASIIKTKTASRIDSNKTKAGHVHVSGAPAPFYSLATGLAFNLAVNLAFYTSEHSDANISSILMTPLVTIKKQFAFPLQFSIWTKNNKYYIVGDWRFLTYPEATYGLGGLTKENDADSLNYNYVRVYTFILRHIKKDFYAGIGYQFDNHWNIQQLNVPPKTNYNYSSYGFSTHSVSSGVSAVILFDDRRNSISPEAGSMYANVVLRQNLQALAGNSNWSSLLIDLRKYFRLNSYTKNVLAVWSYNFITLHGQPPYMDLPSTGWDTYGNTGRGYIQSRFRSKNMIDLESEYRFNILNNGLLGGVVFGNLQEYSEYPGNKFESINPGYGAGLRIKFNKFSRTNICLDYAFGLHGSNGLFVNLGEVF